MCRYQQTVQTVPDDLRDASCGKAHNGCSTAQALDADQRVVVCQCRIKQQVKCCIQTRQLGRVMHIL